MDILLVADGRSPTTRRWLNHLLASGYQVGLISSFPCQPLPGLAKMAVIPVAFGQFAGLVPKQTATDRLDVGQVLSLSGFKQIVSRFRGVFLAGRYWLGPLSVMYYAGQVRQIIAQWQPTLVHALRIPFEGMLASFSPPEVPLVVSIWGNDLTLHARGSAGMRRLTVQCLRRAGGLMADARRDLRLAGLWGFAPGKPRLALPGSGGIDLAEINAIQPDASMLEEFGLPAGSPLVINPRGFRPGSVRNDTFFQSIPLVLAQRPETIFACPAMAGQAEALQWVQRLDIAAAVRLLPVLPQRQLWELFKQAAACVSPSAHDGTPNTLLESMACGSFPIAGDIESLREWITPGVNGLLIDPADPAHLASAILQAISSPTLRQQAAEINAGIIASRADASLIRDQIKGFYHSIGLPN